MFWGLALGEVRYLSLPALVRRCAILPIMRATLVGLLALALPSCADEPRRIDIELSDTEDLTVIPVEHVSHGDRIVFALPRNVLGFSIVSFGHEYETGVGVYRVVSPSGIRFVDDYRVGRHPALILSHRIVSAAAVPQTDAFGTMDIEPGDWHAVFGGSMDRAELWIRRTEDGRFHGGTVDVDAYVAPDILDNQDSYVASVVEATFPWAGLALGEVRYLSLPAVYTIMDPTEFEEALAVTSGESRPVLNVLFVALLDEPNPNGTIGGKTPRVPAYPYSGTPASGIAVTLWGSHDDDIHKFRHEMGHFMGLFHTTEYHAVADPLFDTPECNNAVIGNTPLECPDADNLMFPSPIGQKLTESQKQVIQASSTYRGLLSTPSNVLADHPTASDTGRFFSPSADQWWYPWCPRSAPHIARTLALDSETAARAVSIAIDQSLPVAVRERALQVVVYSGRADVRAILGELATAGDVPKNIQLRAQLELWKISKRRL